MRTHRVALCLLAGTSATLGVLFSTAEAHAPVAVALDGRFASGTARVNGTLLHYVRGGRGPPLVLLHGFPQDWSEYQTIMPRLAARFTVIAVDLRGVGGSEATPGGYDAANMAEDVSQLVESLKLQRPYVVGHDLGAIVAYAWVRRHPEGVRGAMLLDAPIPGVEGWDEAMSSPAVWHVAFMSTPDVPEKLVAGRHQVYLDYFFQFSKFTPAERARYLKAYESAAQLRAAFEMYRAFPADIRFNTAHHGPSDVPLFLAAGAKSPFAHLLPQMAHGLRADGFRHVETGLIPGAVHYVVEDQPAAVEDLIEQHAGEETR
jgi:pimeloyl-ACP methyl ester carboxylesterase